MNIKGITTSLINKSAGLYELKINKGRFKEYKLTYYREFFNKNLDLTLLWIRDLKGKFLGYRLKHINNGKVIKKIDRFA